MAAVFNYLGFGNNTLPKDKPATEPINNPVRALPGQWYTTPEMFELERRAIFSRRWLLMTHKIRIPEAGNFLRYNVAGFDIVIIRGRNGIDVNAFHNVCRHRAYPVVEQPEGKKTILACKYHGWSYGLDGKLAKAPQYQELDGFDKSSNSLFGIHTHVDSNGFIWINMDGKEKPEIPWEQDFNTVDKQERFEDFNFDDYELDHTYELQGKYNWKIACDNFNECYHCPTTHPDVPAFLNTESADVEVKDGHMQHDHASTPEQRKKGFNVNSTYYFPNVSMSVSPHWLMIQKFLPNAPSNSTMQYEIYKNKNSSNEDFKLISDMYARVMGEDKVLCERAQKNINAGVFVGGQMHPRCEKGPLYIQQRVRETIYEHFHKEKAAGQEIWPARQQIPDGDSVAQTDLDICNSLTCATQKEGLAW